MGRDWLAWHDPYDVAGSGLHQRLAVVQRHLRELLDASSPGPIRLISMCAGQGRDVLGVLADHPRCADVVGRLVELDGRNVERARRTAAELASSGIDVLQGDASTTSAYDGAVPADIVLACGVFGNVADADIRTTIDALPGLCAAAASVIWTRYPRDPELLPQIDAWFRAVGFDQVALEVGDEGRRYGVGVHRLVTEPRPFRPGVRLFTFLDDPDPTGAKAAPTR